jgi:hypothetical protein
LRRLWRVLCAIASVGVLAACAPALDWREVRVGAAESVALFPCKPAAHARELLLAGQAVKLTLHACQAADATWGLAWADVGDPSRVAAALQALQEGVRANLGDAKVQVRQHTVKGQTPHPASGRWSLDGRYPDGKPVSGQVAVFSRGTVVFQATVLGVPSDSEGADTYFAALRFGP